MDEILKGPMGTRGSGWIRPLIRATLFGVALLLGIIALLGFLFFREAILDLTFVPTDAMKPSIQAGDHVVINRIAYGLKIPLTPYWIFRRANPQRGEIVVLLSPQDGKRILKRIVALPGETVEVRRYGVIIDGVAAEYSRTESTFAPWLDREEDESADFVIESLYEVQYPIGVVNRAPLVSLSRGPLEIPPGHYFVLGDARYNSLDSRFFGTVPLEHITGKATHVLRRSSGHWDTLQPIPND